MAVRRSRGILPGTAAAREIAESQARFARGEATVTLEELRQISAQRRKLASNPIASMEQQVVVGIPAGRLKRRVRSIKVAPEKKTFA